MEKYYVGMLVELCGTRYIVSFVSISTYYCEIYKISPFKNFGIVDTYMFKILSKNFYGETEPVNNYFRYFCFWCNVETKNSTCGYYCPKCLR